MKKLLLLLLLLSIGFTGTVSAHLEDAIICKPVVVTKDSGLGREFHFQLSVVVQNNTDSTNNTASAGIFSPSGELIKIVEVFSSDVEPGGTGTYQNFEILFIMSAEKAEIQDNTDRHLQLYADKYKGSTCKIFGYK